MNIDNGMEASISFKEITFGHVSEEERARVRRDLEEYCRLDTWAEVIIVGELGYICS